MQDFHSNSMIMKIFGRFIIFLMMSTLNDILKRLKGYGRDFGQIL